MKKIIFLFVALFSQFNFSQNGTLDSSFDADGKLSFAHPDGLANAPSFHGVDVQNDGKILAVGTDRVVVRLNADGSFDNTFDTDGKLLLTNMVEIFTVKALADGKILVGGIGTTKFTITGIPFKCFGVVKLNTDGSMDSTFGTNGYAAVTFTYEKDCEAYDMAVQNDGKIVLVGNAEISTPVGYDDFAFARLNSNGTLDTSFATNGKLTFSLANYDYLYGVTIGNDGTIVAVGKHDPGNTSKDSVIISLNSDGSFNSNFDTDGKLVLPIAVNVDYLNDVKIQSDGKIVACGFVINSFALPGEWLVVRLNSDGSLDNTFHSDGKVNFTFSAWGGDLAHELLLQNDGKIIVGGMGIPSVSPVFCLAKLNADGSFDTTFGNSGKVSNAFPSNSHCKGLTFQADGKIIAVGLLQNGGDFLAIARFHNDANLSTSQLTFQDKFMMFPNPSNGIVNILLSEDLIGSNLIVSNLMGQKIIAYQLISKENVINLNSGIYFISIEKNGLISTKKIVVK